MPILQKKQLGNEHLKANLFSEKELTDDNQRMNGWHEKPFVIICAQDLWL